MNARATVRINPKPAASHSLTFTTMFGPVSPAQQSDIALHVAATDTASTFDSTMQIEDACTRFAP